jgi:GNAT superfamily N-acetyltransferase
VRSSRSRRSRTSESIVVRDATVADARGILGVRARSWRAAYAHVFAVEQLEGLTQSAGEWVAWWEGVIGTPRAQSHVFVVERAATVVGFAHLGSARGDEEDTVGELYAIYVDPSAWGEGIGQALMGETLGRLRAEGFGVAMLWVLEDNPRTRRFYETSGWRPDGGAQHEELLGTLVNEVRYRITL